MIEPSLSDLVLRISVHRNLDATVGTFKAIDVPVWQKLLDADPVEFLNLAAYGYKMRQGRKGPREIRREEVDDFQRQFLWKFYLIALREKDSIPKDFAELEMFEVQ